MPIVTSLLTQYGNLVEIDRMSKVPFVKVRIDEQNIQSGAKEVLRIVRPSWNSKYGDANIKYKVFTDGLSNKLVGFYVEDNKEDIVIVKVFGTNTDVMIDRQAEIDTMRLLYERKCGAELYATFDNGICYQFMNGITLEVEHCSDPKIFPLVAAEMAKMHSDLAKNPKHKSIRNGKHEETLSNDVKRNGFQHKSQMWNKLRHFNKLCESLLANDSKFRQRMEKVGVIPGWSTDAINELEAIVDLQDMPVTFCHNDLIPRNIVYDENKGKITFIDVEYAMYNYPAFDVANHFLEFAGIDNIDYSKYPNQTFRYTWIREYLKHLKLDYPEKITEEKFDFWVQLCAPASHLIWGLWGIYQAKHSTINFDYDGYVGLRFSEYRKLIEKLRRTTTQIQGQA